MIIAGEFSFNQGKEKLENNYPQYLNEIRQVIKDTDASLCKTKKSQEKTRKYQLLYKPNCLNKSIAEKFKLKNWQKKRVPCDYSQKYYTPQYAPKYDIDNKNAYREMDFLKNQVGVEVQFGKYSFMVYNVCAKMTIFSNLIGIEVGVEIVPIKDLAMEMSTGVSYFEQFVWDLENRGVSNIDLPVFIIGIAP